MRSLMSASKRSEFDELVSKSRMPELTREAVYATFGALHESRADMFDQGVIECFKKLSWVIQDESAAEIWQAHHRELSHLHLRDQP